MRIILLLTVIGFALQVNAAELKSAQSTTSVSHHSYSNKKKTTLEFLFASEQMKSNYTGELDGSYNKLDASFLTRLNKNNSMRFYLSTRYLQYENEPNEFNWYLSEIMWRRKNLLSSFTDKVKMEFELKGYYMLEDEIGEQYGFNGAVVPQFIFKTMVSNNISMKLKVRKHFFDANNSDDYVLKTEDRVYLSATYIHSRFLMFNTSLKYSKKIRNDKHYSYKEGRFEDANLQVITFHPSVMFVAGHIAMVELYAETKLSDSASELSGTNLMESEQVFGTALYLTAW